MEYLKVIAVSLIALMILVLAVVKFCQKSREEKIDIVIHWLRVIVYEAEEALGGGTGQLKLARVYRITIDRFPWIAKLYSYDDFNNKLVKPTLEWLNVQMASNENVKKLLGL